MCGICGIVNSDARRKVHACQIDVMLGTMLHRGPDDAGVHIDGHVGLGQRRLSIIDLESGHQPLANENGRVWITFNGEIYNYRELRAELEQQGHAFATKSDTEVIVHLYEEHGEDCVLKLRGMFAFAIYDSDRDSLFLARDRLGVKPLYYAATPEGFVFSSEIKGILKSGVFDGRIDEAALGLFLSFFYTPGGETLFHGISKLRPGCSATWRDGTVTEKRYWDLAPYFLSKAEGTGQRLTALENLLDESMRLHLISDVPVGFLLSGGVDSSALLDIAHRQNGGEQLKCFTIGFAGESFEDERHYARLVAERLGLTHFQTTISREEFFETLPTFLWHLEEPICEPPAIALYFVSKLAREHVKVVISGEGGDEAFAGYPNYRNNMLFEWAKSVLGRSGSRLMSRLLSGVKDRRVAKYARHFQMPLESYYFSRTSSPCAMLAGMRGELLRTADAETGAAEAAEDVIARHFAKMNGAHILDKMLYVDTVTWLPDDLLLKADKITMAHSLELRVPLLDHMVMQFAASLPPRDKVRGMATKYILKKAFEGRVPTEVLRRRKSGFPVPYERWMQEKKSMIWEVLLDGRTLKRGFFNAPILTDKVYRRLKGNERMPKELFSLFILELWARLFLDGSTVTLN